MRVFRPARVAVPGVLGPYDAVIPLLAHGDPTARARFTRETVERIAADCERLADSLGGGTGRLRVNDESVEVLRFDKECRSWHATSTIAPDEDGLYRFEQRHFVWTEVAPGGLTDLHPALAAAGMTARLGIGAPEEGPVLRVELDGAQLRITEEPGARLAWRICGQGDGGSLTWYEAGTEPLVEQIVQLASAPHSQYLTELFRAYVHLRFTDHRGEVRVVMEPDDRYEVRIALHLPDGERIDLLHGTETGEPRWMLRDTYRHFEPGLIAKSNTPFQTDADVAADAASRYLLSLRTPAPV